MNTNPHNRVSCGAYYPESPIIGRFVSPWDTSGWYSVYANFGIGAKLHSNENVTAAKVPARYVGADYIMTFNSKADGFDDKQEVDFFCERDAVVAVALDETLTTPDWTADFLATGDKIEGSDGRTYVVYEKSYEAGELVHIPGIEGDSNHFIVMAIATSDEEKKTLAPLPAPGEALPAYEKRDYKSYLVEVFNSEDSLVRFSGHGCSIQMRPDDPRNGYVAMTADSYLSYPIENPSSRIIATAKLNCKEGILAAAILGKSGAICGAVLDGNMLCTMDGETIMPYTPGENMNIRIVLDTDRGEYDVWANTRVAAKGIEVLSDAEPVAVGFSCDGIGELDNLYVFDDTEIYAVKEEFTSDAIDMTPTANAKIALENIPFASDKSVSLVSENDEDASAEYRFPAISGVVTIETKVHPEDESLVIVPTVTDDKGNVACRVAFYKNCLFATNGNDWVEIFEGLVDWQYYPSGNWYQLKLSLDTENSVYTLMVDGAVRAKNFAFANKIESASRLVYTAAAGTRLLINRIRIYDAWPRGSRPHQARTRSYQGIQLCRLRDCPDDGRR